MNTDKLEIVYLKVNKFIFKQDEHFELESRESSQSDAVGDLGLHRRSSARRLWTWCLGHAVLPTDVRLARRSNLGLWYCPFDVRDEGAAPKNAQPGAAVTTLRRT